MPGKGRENGTEQRNSENMYGHEDYFQPTTIMSENEAGGWLTTTKPVGVTDGELPILHTAGSRGIETKDNRTVGGVKHRRKPIE